MIETSLHKQLQQLQQKLDEDMLRVAAERQRLGVAIEQTSNEIERLHAQLRELRERHNGLEKATADIEIVYQQQQRQTTLEALKNSFEQLQKTQDYWIAMAHSPKRREEIAAAIPDLPQLLADYRAFDPESEAVVNLPKTFRETLLEEHRRLAKLKPYFELEAEEAELTLAQPVTLRIVGLHNTEKNAFCGYYLIVIPRLCLTKRVVSKRCGMGSSKSDCQPGPGAGWILMMLM